MDTFGALLLCSALFLAWAGMERWKRWKDLSAFASSNGCKPAQRHLHNPWWLPFGLDKMLPTLKADRAGRLPAFMLQEFEKHGHTYSQRVTGQLVVLTRSPANVQTVCKTRFKDYEIGSDRAGNFGALIGHGILALDGREWTRSRAMLRPHFTRNFDQDFVQLEGHVQHLLRRLNDVASRNMPVDIGDLFLKLSTDFATEAVFGHSTDSLLLDLKHWSGEQDKGSAGDFSLAVDHALHMLGQRGQLINFYWLRDSPRFRRSCRTCQAFVNRYLEDARQSQSQTIVEDLGKGGTTSFMHSLVARDNIPADVIRDQLLALLVASRDTSASFASWVIYALARHTEVMAKLRSLIDTHLPRGRLPTAADIAALPYLRHVLNETLRIFPVVPLNGRTAKVNTILPEGGGPDGKSPLLVPAGTKVAFNIYALHHRRDIFGMDADAFRPERWEEVGAGTVGDFEGAFVPFILGPRVCLGKNMAMMTVSYLIVRILQKFDRLEAVDSPASQSLPRDSRNWPSEDTRYDMEDKETTFSIGVTMSPRDGVWVKLRSAGDT
ncbi:uncharacterized protein PV07_02933 [Cladophialophora immunda]|uniref:Uncharacterized protein n=1 Tax=Cladophialophora immunda TaxID=569365 RepID=A0A0D1ZT47_9EURO|nr:uncharacterized protein PV07_02933 [Cladophialophora immunda]KIW31271.1 hypothetical protein PV07_02933 [Cladophialophora immunda]